MPQITTKQVMDLRAQTGAGIMDCKNMLKETQGDAEKAVELLRKKGLSGLAKRAGRIMKEGCVGVQVSGDGKTMSILEINCETDFVARNPEIKNFSNEILSLMLTDENMSNPAENEDIKKKLQELAIKVGENMAIRRGSVYKLSDHDVANYYVHGDFKKAAMVSLKFEGDLSSAADELNELAKNLSMQAVAMNPRWLKKENVPTEIIEKEKEIYKENPKAKGKSGIALEKMLEGRINKFYQENCLLEQSSIKDSKVSISKVIDGLADKLKGKIELSKFDCYIVGLE